MVVQRRSRVDNQPKYTRADVEALVSQYDEPQWLSDFRFEAWDLYESLPMPGHEEEWRRTDYSHIQWQDASNKIVPNGATVDTVPQKNLEPLVGGQQGGLLVFVDGKLVQNDVADELIQQGVVFKDLHTALKENEEIVREYFMTQAVKPTDGKFAALHGALWDHGVVLYVPKNKAIEQPLHVVMYNTKDGSHLAHMLVVIGENAQATLQVDYASADGSTNSAYIGATELIVGDAANLRYVALQEWNRQTYEFSHQRAMVGRDANLDWVIGNMGTRLTKAFIEVDIVGAGSNARVSGFFFADKDQFFDLDTQQNHNAPLTTSDLLFKGAAKDHARTLWQGMIKSLPKMQKIDGYQVCRNLVLSPDARMDSIPGLEIEADDVMCSHAATFGTLEEELLYYLMSRGIPRPEAQLMIIDGFFDELLQRIPFERVRERLQSEIEAKILG
ncbi:Fe-S cluster assembly protein SufD [Phototrophicus methaneseepsis]|uniref:Fe-S cluster assembly protein SufD n=1 Tax=Phototrophicus methaneseepsis TaxID=2710758 RepID=A0A7S8E650_9CHLR|nr:Fe-S cluster assembly protein SufD [Phototrophicus methaneseepsis]QPC81093.1 Fe-S cluster assembly protein SufD [Phototrophicus methaneseepsis]